METFLTDEAIENHEVKGQVDAPIFFDVDDTLVLHTWPEELDSKKMVILDEKDIAFEVVPHEPHIQRMREHARRGCKIYVWSQGGEAWARRVIEELGLTSLVTEIMTKPAWIYDDIAMKTWCPDEYRVYLDPVHGCNAKDVHEPNEYGIKQRDLLDKLWKQLCAAKAELAHIKSEIGGVEDAEGKSSGKKTKKNKN